MPPRIALAAYEAFKANSEPPHREYADLPLRSQKLFEAMSEAVVKEYRGSLTETQKPTHLVSIAWRGMKDVPCVAGHISDLGLGTKYVTPIEGPLKGQSIEAHYFQMTEV